MDYSRNLEVLGVNRMGKNIKKSPIHQPNFANNSDFGASRPQPPSQVYNINKSDFRSIVQQLTGSSPSQHTSLPRPHQNPSKNLGSTRLQRIRPAPLMPIMNQPQISTNSRVAHIPAQPSCSNNNYVRPAAVVCSRPLSPEPFDPIDVWENSDKSPISAYMQYLQGSIIDSAEPKQAQPHQGPVCNQPLSDFLANSPRFLGPPLPSPWMNGDAPIPSPLLPSPTGFVNLFSPCTPYPLFSPGVQYPPPLSPKFSFSPMGQLGILGDGPRSSPLSPGYGFPLSPSGFFPVCSPRWRDE